MKANSMHITHLTKPGKLLVALVFLLSAFAGCKKADNFNAKETALPQIDYQKYPYQTTYIVGDTLKITGRLQPKNNLTVTIGGVAATIIKVDSVAGPTLTLGKITQTMEDQVSIRIDAGMVGTAREVKITTGGYSVTGSPVDVYTAGGEGSFNSILKSVLVTPSTLSNTYRFLYAVTGKGDVFYYAPATKDIRHIAKDGTATILYSLAPLNITNFLAGAVDPQEQNLYFSVQLATGYVLYKFNLQNNTLSTLNTSVGLSAPYEGGIGTVQMIVGGIYPDSKGNLYLGMGLGNKAAAPTYLPDAIAHYNAADGTIRYIFKGFIYQGQSYPDMPGVNIPVTGNSNNIRFSPDENLLYIMAPGTSGVGGSMGIRLFDLSIGIQLADLETSNNGSDPASQYKVISTFAGLKINIPFNSPDGAFGFLPMPGKRLQVLLFQNYQNGAQNGFPKWVVFDFTAKRTYAYGLGKFQQGDSGQYTFRANDQLLNTDEAGNLYATSNGISYLLKTQPVN